MSGRTAVSGCAIPKARAESPGITAAIVSNRPDVIERVTAELSGRCVPVHHRSELGAKLPLNRAVLIDLSGLPVGLDLLSVRLAWRMAPILALADRKDPVALTAGAMRIVDGVICLEEVGRLLSDACELAEEKMAVMPAWFAGGETLQAARLERLAQLPLAVQRVMSLLGKGYTNPEIASVLDLSDSTVKAYVARILETLGLDGRTAAAVFLWEAGQAKRA